MDRFAGLTELEDDAMDGKCQIFADALRELNND
jgi:hypothetical protein